MEKEIRTSPQQRISRMQVSICLALLVIIGTLVGLNYFGLETMASVRSYVRGEGLYAKAHKSAILALSRYAWSHDEADYAAYQTAIAVPQGDGQARRALSQTPPDLQAAHAGFVQGGNHPDDIPGMITLFLRFHRVSYIDRAIAIWEEADALIDQVDARAQALRREAAAPAPDSAAVQAILADLHALDLALTALEDEFSLVLSEGARWLRNMLLGINLLSALFLYGIGMTYYTASTRRVRRSQAALRASEQQYRALAETANDAIITADEEGTIVFANRAVAQVFGYAPDELIGQSLTQLMPERYASSHTAGMARFRTTGEKALDWQLVAAVGLRKDGVEIPLELSMADFSNEGTRYITSVIRDISDRKQFEAELVAAKEHAEELNRAKSTFLSNMSHEIRTPLTSIIGFAEILGSGIEGEHRNLARMIERGGNRLLRTLNSVLDLSSLEARRLRIRRERFDLDRLVREAVILLQPQGQQKGVALRYEGPDRPVVVDLDPGALQRILDNLVGNALKFTREGSVTVRVEARAEEVCIQVADTGVGIAPEFMPHLFDAFRQESTGLSRRHEGSGLGLAITQRLVELMDGTIDVASTKGRGTTFTLTFPQDTPGLDAAPAPAAIDASEQRPDAESRRILLVEDKASIQHLVRYMLADVGVVDGVRTGGDALKAIDQQDYDLLLLDLNLGEKPNGEEVLRLVRARPTYHTVPVLALTAHALPGERERLLELGFDGYVSKPFTKQHLMEAVTAGFRANTADIAEKSPSIA